MELNLMADMILQLRQNLGYLIDGTITLCLYCFLVNKRSYIANNRLMTIGLILSYGVVRFFVENHVVKGIGPLIAIVLISIILSRVIKVKMALSFIANMIVIITFIFFDGFYYMLVPLIENSHFSALVKALLLLANHWTVSGIHLLVIWFLYTKGDFVLKLRLFEQKASYILVGVANVMFMILFYLITAFTSLLQDNRVVYQFVLLILIPITVALSILDYFKREKDFKLRYEYEKRDMYVFNMERLIEQLREHRHDTQNHLSAIYGMVAGHEQSDDESFNRDNLKTLKNYLQKLLNDTDESGFKFKTSDSYVDGLLCIKGSEAENNNIHMNVDMKLPLSRFGFSSEQWISILGNLIDNSIDALKSSNQSLKVIGIESDKQDNKAILTVFNNGPEIDEKTKGSIFKRGFSTKGEEHKERGYGLYIVEKTVVDKNGSIEAVCSEEWTKFVIEVEAV